MVDRAVTVEFEGTESLFDARAYLEAFGAVLAVLRETDNDVARDAGATGPTLRWLIRSLHSSSPTVELVPESMVEDLDLSEQVIFAATAGLRTLQEGPNRPQGLSYPWLERCQDLGELLRRDALSQITVQADHRRVELTERLDLNVRQLMARKVEQWGSVGGELAMVTLRGRRYFNVYSWATGRATRCYFTQEMFDQVRTALGREVVVKGLLRSFAHEEGREIAEITELTVLDEIGELPGPEHIRGIMPNLTGGRPSEEWLRERWGGQRQP